METHMRKSLIAGLALFVSVAANAAVGVTVGANKMSDADGFPVLQANEQAQIFYCTGKMSGPEAQDCALKKCLAKFKVKADAPRKEFKNGSHTTTVIGGHCSPDGWSARKGHSIIMVGPKGDNQYIMSKALGDPTREVAMEYVKSNKFPVDKATMILDYYDKDGE